MDLNKAEMARAQIDMKAGELKIRGGAAKLLEAEFSYEDDLWKPEVRYGESGFRGNLRIWQPHIPFRVGPGGGGSKNEWDLRLKDDVPLDLEVSLGAGKSVLDLKGLYLRSLDVHMGAGEVDLDLTGKWRKSFDARVRGGVGRATVYLPKEVGVEATARGAIGEIRADGFTRSGHNYTNGAYGKTPVTLRVDVEGGIGEINLRLEP